MQDSNLSSGSKQDKLDQYGFESSRLSQSVTSDKKDLKRMNARTEKWRQMLSKFAEFQHSEKLKERVRKGIPNGMRCKAWPMLAEIQRLQSENPELDYEELIKRVDFPYEHDIVVDLPRTFPNHFLFKKDQDENLGMASLKNILKALSLSFQDMGYCQGINFLGAALIIHLNDEQSFWVLLSLMKKYNCLEIYQDVAVIKKYLYVHDELLRKFMPQVAQRFQEQSVDSLYYATKWYMTLFSAVLPFNLFLRQAHEQREQGLRLLEKADRAAREAVCRLGPRQKANL